MEQGAIEEGQERLLLRELTVYTHGFLRAMIRY